MGLNDFFRLSVAVGVSEMAGVIGSIFTAPAVRSAWYAELVRPALNPPAWVFGPVWITLYALMGIALFLVWKQHPNILEYVGVLWVRRVGVVLFFAQLVLNALWSVVFFGLQSPVGAFTVIVFLWLAILATIIVFARVSRLAAWLLAPYLLWVSFAAYLNYSFWVLN